MDIKQKRQIALDTSLEIRERMVSQNSNWSQILSVFIDSPELEDYVRAKLAGENAAQMSVIEKAITLAHNAHKQAEGNMLADERELYEAVLELERLRS